MKGVSARTITKENILEAMNKEIIPLLREMRTLLTNGSLIRTSYEPLNFLRELVEPTDDIRRTSSLLRGIDTALGVRAAATLAVLAELNSRIGSPVNFSHPGQIGNASRRMYPGYGIFNYNIAVNEWAARVILPDAGELTSLSAQNPSPSAGFAEVSTYTVYLSTDNGLTFSPTALTVSMIAGDTAVHKFIAEPPVPVPAGALIGVQIDYSGAVTASGPEDTQVATVRYKPT